MKKSDLLEYTELSQSQYWELTRNRSDKHTLGMFRQENTKQGKRNNHTELELYKMRCYSRLRKLGLTHRATVEVLV